MKIKIVSFVLVSLLATLSVPLNAQVILDVQNCSKFKRKIFTVSKLNTGSIVDLGAIQSSGVVSTSSVGPRESFTVRAQAVNDWDFEESTHAIAATGVDEYIKTRMRAKISGSRGGWGVDVLNGPGETFIDQAGEALVFEFMLDELTSEHRAMFRLKGFEMIDLGDGDQFSYMIIDAEKNVVVASGTSRKNRDRPKDYVIGDRYLFVVGHDVGSFKLGRLEVDIVHDGSADSSDEYVEIPEPSMFVFVLIVGAFAVVMVRRVKVR